MGNLTELMQACDQHFGVFAVTMGIGLVVVTSAFKGVVSICTTASRERTRREIAAYIAEGTISPEQGEKLLKTAVNGKSAEC